MGITWEPFDDSPGLDAEAQEATRREMVGRYLHIAEVALPVPTAGVGFPNPLR